MKNFDSRTYSVNDIFEWYKNRQLELSPKFQRKSVWTENARSYLMDTIIRGKPIPKIFIRQQLNPSTHITTREVVDGQQRLRTILTFLSDGFQISRKHNEEYGGLFYSQLAPEIQANILNYEISTDLLVNQPDSEVLDIFGRLNSYAVVLNSQEKINADHFGPFKTLADKLGHTYYDFWVTNKILSDSQIIRMADVSMAADLLIASIEGIKSKKQVKSYYATYEKDFPYDTNELERKFAQILEDIDKTFESDLKKSEFRRPHLFYTLYTTYYHFRYGLRNFPTTNKLDKWNYSRLRTLLNPAEEAFTQEDKKSLNRDQITFLSDSRNATTDTVVRSRRTSYLVGLIQDGI